jgi:hypothetical protein
MSLNLIFFFKLKFVSVVCTKTLKLMTVHTLGGPMMDPIQSVSVVSLSLARPQLMLPSPTPFSPNSSSSNRRKFRGTTAKVKNNSIMKGVTLSPLSFGSDVYNSQLVLLLVNHHAVPQHKAFFFFIFLELLW